MKTVEQQWYNAYKAYMRAQDPQFKKFWLQLMKHFSKEFN